MSQTSPVTANQDFADTLPLYESLNEAQQGKPPANGTVISLPRRPA